MKGQVKSCENKLNECELEIDDQMKSCVQAEKIRDSEAKYLPLFKALVNNDPQVHEYCTMEVERILMICMVCCNGSLKQKSSFVFNRFISNDERFLKREQVFNILLQCTRAMESLGGCLIVKPCPDLFIESMVDRMLLETKTRDGVCKFEFNTWVMYTVSSSKDLSELFGVTWKHSHLSQLQLSHLSTIKRYELGLKSLQATGNEIDQIWCTYREELSQERKRELHERALAMGANDPLKVSNNYI